MFQFPGFAPHSWYLVFNQVGCPIQTSTDQVFSADPRSFSQLGTSFFASKSLGIPRTPFITFFKYSQFLDMYFILHYISFNMSSVIMSKNL